MQEQKERAARCNRTTPARTPETSPVRGSRSTSIARRRRLAKRKIRTGIALAALLLIVVVCIAAVHGDDPQPQGDRGPAGVPTMTGDTLASFTPAETFGPATPDPTATPETPPPPRYELSDSERDTVERVVMAEAGGECYEGQMLVAQCILNAAEKSGKQPSEAVKVYKYATARPDPTQSVRDAVAAVFDRGETITDEPILYFYNPAKVTSAWHESQIFVIEVGGHRFFAEKGANT